jgi:cytochrome P450
MTVLDLDQRLLGLPGWALDARTPARFDDQRSSWQVFSYRDVRRVTRAGAEFSQAFGDPASAELNYRVMWMADGQRHDDLRHLVREPFSRASLRQLEPGIRELTNQLLDAIEAHGGPFNVVAELAGPLPARVICQILGVDVVADAQFDAWSAEFVQAAAVHQTVVQEDKTRFFADLVEGHRQCPQGGLVDQLVTAQQDGVHVDGAPLDDRDIAAYLWGLAAAGKHTTCAGIASMLLILSEWDGWKELRANPGLRDGAIVECLRLCTPFPQVTARAVQAVRIAGHEVHPGEFVTPWFSAANRDPDQFPEPDTFDPRRRNSQHVAFAQGPHRCLGAPLALLLMRNVLDAVLHRWGSVHWQRDLPYGRVPGGLINCVSEAWMSRGSN